PMGSITHGRVRRVRRRQRRGRRAPAPHAREGVHGRRAAADRLRHAALRAVRPDQNVDRSRASTSDGAGSAALLFAPVAVYGGYCGAGMSVMLLAILSVSRPDDFRAINVIKNLLASLTSVVAVLVFVAQGVVAWPPTLVVMAGAALGGFAGGRLVRVVSPDLMRWAVIAIGTILTVGYARRYWLPLM